MLFSLVVSQVHLVFDRNEQEQAEANDNEKDG